MPALVEGNSEKEARVVSPISVNRWHSRVENMVPSHVFCVSSVDDLPFDVRSVCDTGR